MSPDIRHTARYVIGYTLSEHPLWLQWRAKTGYAHGPDLSEAARFLTRHAAETVKQQQMLPKGWQVKDLDKLRKDQERGGPDLPF